jgi:hypothetical protein
MPRREQANETKFENLQQQNLKTDARLDEEKCYRSISYPLKPIESQVQ